mmetsp:Transcript_20493/g.44593  ORF Transcript_20493/g.44593 Transcript_20493/m.44593 type:complete len:112 (+) Transcript_20493:886-1221(+)
MFPYHPKRSCYENAQHDDNFCLVHVGRSRFQKSLPEELAPHYNHGYGHTGVLNSSKLVVFLAWADFVYQVYPADYSQCEIHNVFLSSMLSRENLWPKTFPGADYSLLRINQ